MLAKSTVFRVVAVVTILAVSGLMSILAGCGPAATPEPEPEPTTPPAAPTTPPAEPEPTARPDGERYGGTLFNTMRSYEQPFYPPTHTSSFVTWRLTQVFGCLVNWVVGSADGEVYPDVAESWDVSDDGLEYTFHLRQGAKFHNGDEITAEDAVFSLQAYYSDEGLPYASSFAGVDKIEEVDKYTLLITLKEPNPYFIQGIAGARASAIMPKKAVQEFGDDFGTSPETTVGSGPFVLTEWSDTQLVYEAFEDFYFGRPYLDGINTKIVPDFNTGILEFKAGNVDIQSLISPFSAEFMADPTLEPLTHAGTAPTPWWWAFNVNVPPFDDVRVRQAVNYAVDQAEMLEISRGGTSLPANQWLPPGLLGHDDSIQYYARDPEKAKQLLAEAGYPDGLDITVNVWNISESVTDAQVIAAQLNEAGFNAEVLPTDFGTYSAEIGKGSYGFFLYGELLEFDTAKMYRWFWHSDGSLNYAGYANPDLDALIEEAEGEFDLTKRGELLVEMEKMLLEDAVYVPNLFKGIYVAVQPWVHGFEDVNIVIGAYSQHKVRFEGVWLDPDKMDR